MISSNIQLVNDHCFWLYIQESGAASRQNLVTDCQMKMKIYISFLSHTYERDGYIGSITTLSLDTAAQHRAWMEAAKE